MGSLTFSELAVIAVIAILIALVARRFLGKKG